MKRVLIISLSYFPKFYGGAEVAVKEITDRIKHSEIEFHLIGLRYDKHLPIYERMGNVVVHRIGFTTDNPSVADLRKFPLHLNKYIFQFWAAWCAHRLHQEYEFDALWAMMAHSCGVPAALFKMMHKDVKYILTLQEGDPPEHIERLAKPVWPLFVRAFTKADTIQTISHFLARWAKRMGYTGEPIVVPNAVNTKHFAQIYSSEEIDTLQQFLGKKEGDIFLITTSRLVKKNACDDVIRALVHLPSSIHFIILGIGPDEILLKSLAHELGVIDRVKFLGQVAHSEMPKYLKACDIFIRPSLSEGMGNSFVEAMASELPVVATQEGGIADFLFDRKLNPEKPSTGWAVKPRDPKGIAQAVKTIIENPKERDETVANAKKLVFAEYDWDKIAKDMKSKVFDHLWKQ